MQSVSVEGVNKVFNKGQANETVVLRDVSLRIGAGEFVVLRGPSGSGKTTLLCMLSAMARPTSGRVLVGEENIAKLPERFLTAHHRSTFGFIFQQFNLIPELTALENVMVPLVPTDLGMARMRELAARALEKLGLADRAGIKPKHLSGGEQQRVAVARALVNDPKVIIADEPTAHLDGALSRSLLTELERIHGEGRTLIVATHDPKVWECPRIDRIVDMRDGRIVGELSR